MKVRQNTQNWAVCALAVLALANGVARANVEGNPYATIVDRNPFALKPPPPPPPPPETTAPPVPMAKVTLTGIVSTFGEPRALFEIIEDAKAGTTPKRPILREGERLGPVEVLGIDVVKNMVRLRNSGVETNVTFNVEVAKAGPVPGGLGVPGAPPAFTPPPINVPQPLGHSPQASSPTVISPNGAAPGGGVTLMGNNAAASTTAGLPGALGGSADGGMRTIPSRPLRTENAANNSGPPMTKEQADLLMEVNRLRGGPPLPPTSLTPIIQGAEHEGQNQNPAYPRLPYNPRGGPPPLPGR
ncbi:MAG TPA: hypothetical protein VK850_15320 [Candidatus Binatia bacterium]|nr:hypothetical protein [Candidatus Binatia bacterium]